MDVLIAPKLGFNYFKKNVGIPDRHHGMLPTDRLLIACFRYGVEGCVFQTCGVWEETPVREFFFSGFRKAS